MDNLKSFVENLNIEDAKKMKDIAETATFAINANLQLKNKEELLELTDNIILYTKDRIKKIAMIQIENNL